MNFLISHVTSNKKSRNLPEKLKVAVHKNTNKTKSKLQNRFAEIKSLVNRKERGTIGNKKSTGQKEKGKLY